MKGSRLVPALLYGSLYVLVGTMAHVVFKQVLNRWIQVSWFVTCLTTLLMLLQFGLLHFTTEALRPKPRRRPTRDPNATPAEWEPLLPTDTHQEQSPDTSAPRRWISTAFLGSRLRAVAVVSVLHAVANLLRIWGSNTLGPTSGAVVVLITQGVIPITMVLAYPMLGKRYQWTEMVGAALVLVGVVVAVRPNLRFGQPSLCVWCTVLLILSNVPAALSKVHLELLFRTFSPPVLWVSFWEFFIGTPVAFLLALVYFPVQGRPLSDAVVEVNDGFMCLSGGEECGHHSWVLLVVFLLCGTCMVYVGNAVVRLMGSTAGYLLTALQLPLTNWGFTSAAVMGVGSAGPLTVPTAVSTGLIACGLVLYAAPSLGVVKRGSLPRPTPPPGGQL